MTEYNERSVDDPHPGEDRPVAGWPGHTPDHAGEHEQTGEHTGEQTGEYAGERADEATDERRDETPGDDEPLVGEVWSQDSGERAGEHAEDASGWGGERQQGLEDVAETERTDDAEAGRVDDEEPAAGEPVIVAEPVEGSGLTDAERVGGDSSAEEPIASEAAVQPTGEPVAVVEPAESETDTAAEAETVPEAEPVVDGARPTAADQLTVEDLVDPEAAERFRSRWRDVKAVFVDDPSDAVRQASALSGEAVEELTTALTRMREDLDGHWEEGRQTDTERLRVALRGYGSLIERILAR
jgi:hypothetical protein